MFIWFQIVCFGHPKIIRLPYCIKYICLTKDTVTVPVTVRFSENQFSRARPFNFSIASLFLDIFSEDYPPVCIFLPNIFVFFTKLAKLYAEFQNK